MHSECHSISCFENADCSHWNDLNFGLDGYGKPNVQNIKKKTLFQEKPGLSSEKQGFVIDSYNSVSIGSWISRVPAKHLENLVVT